MSPYLYIPRAYIRNDVMFTRNPLRRRVAKFSHLAREDVCVLLLFSLRGKTNSQVYSTSTKRASSIWQGCIPRFLISYSRYREIAKSHLFVEFTNGIWQVHLFFPKKSSYEAHECSKHFRKKSLTWISKKQTHIGLKHFSGNRNLIGKRIFNDSTTQR